MEKNNKIAIETMRHSAAHLLAAAVNELYPGTKFGVGPAVENGFYYDFDLPEAISDEDLSKIEAKMEEIKKRNLALTRSEAGFDDAIEAEKKAEQPYKAELIQLIKDTGDTSVEDNGKVSTATNTNQPEDKNGSSNVSFYTLGEFKDLCRGPHVPNTSEIGPFKLLSVAGAYWRGDEKNKMLTRIYGTAFASQPELDEHLHMLEEAKKRDHRKLGKELELFAVPEDVGPGLFLWLPKGATIKREIEDFERSLQLRQGYQHVYTPHIGKKQLWVQSGHWDLYREKMYSPMEIDGVEYLVKPMSCPMHIQVYQTKPRSYRDLPYKIAEVASVYRYENSGELSGLARVRYFNQDDAHIFCMPDQVETEIIQVLKLLEQLYGAFGLTDMEFWLTTRSEEKKDKYLGSDEVWKNAEGALENALKQENKKYIVAPGEAKFYGPSIDVMVRDSIGRKWQCGTVQVDFALPERFNLTYTGADGLPHQPVMVHRAPLGSLERFMSIIIEHYAGAFPTWLAPVQAMIVPITDKHLEYGQKLLEQFLDAGIRAEIDTRSEKMQAKIREAQLQKIPYMLIIGDREQEQGAVAVRTRSGEDKGAIKFEDFLKDIQEEIKLKR